MKGSYLPSSYFIFFTCVLVLVFYFEFWYLVFFLIIFAVICIFVCRKDSNQDDSSQDDSNQGVEGLLKSPVNGRVVSLKREINHDVFGKDLHELAISMTHFKESGLYLPCSGEFEDKKRVRGKKIFRYIKESLRSGGEGQVESDLLTLRDKKGQLLGFQVVRCFLGLAPKIWVLPGDRGRSGGRFGYIPMGGVFLFYLPDSYEIIIKEGDHLRARESILAKEKMSV